MPAAENFEVAPERLGVEFSHPFNDILRNSASQGMWNTQITVLKLFSSYLDCRKKRVFVSDGAIFIADSGSRRLRSVAPFRHIAQKLVLRKLMTKVDM